MTKYDDASWHSEGDFPRGLPAECGGTHIALFLGWAVLEGLGGEMIEEEAEMTADFVAKRISPRTFLFRCCDGKITDEDLNALGQRFAAYYLPQRYLSDYDRLFGRRYPTLYHVEDSWQNFDEARLTIGQRYRSWKTWRPWLRLMAAPRADD